MHHQPSSSVVLINPTTVHKEASGKGATRKRDRKHEEAKSEKATVQKRQKVSGTMTVTKQMSVREQSSSVI
jgi:hypothetical protein